MVMLVKSSFLYHEILTYKKLAMYVAIFYKFVYLTCRYSAYGQVFLRMYHYKIYTHTYVHTWPCKCRYITSCIVQPCKYLSINVEYLHTYTYLYKCADVHTEYAYQLAIHTQLVVHIRYLHVTSGIYTKSINKRKYVLRLFR